MQLTKFGHTGVDVQAESGAPAIDPGMFSDTSAALTGTDAVLIPHTHAAHFDVDAVLAAAHARPDLRLWAPPTLPRPCQRSAIDSLRSLPAKTSLRAFTESHISRVATDYGLRFGHVNSGDVRER